MSKQSFLERLNALSNREVYVLAAYYLWGYSLMKIGNYFCVTRECIRQTRVKAERRLFGHSLEREDATYQKNIKKLKQEIKKILIFEEK